MIINRREFLYELEKNSQTNFIDSDIWIMNNEKVFYKGKYFLKIIVHQNIEVLDKLKGLTFKVSFENSEIYPKCYEFAKVEKYNDPALFGCLIEMPENYAGENYHVDIFSYILLNEEIRNDKSTVVTVKLNNEQHENEINKYLSNRIKNYTIFPKIEKDYWLCSCGKYNSSNNSECTNCKNEKSYITNLVESGLPSLFVNSYIVNEHKNIDLNISAEKNVTAFKSKLTDYFSLIKNPNVTFDENIVINEYINQQNHSKLVSKNKKVWITSIAFLIVLFIGITIPLNIRRTAELKEIWDGTWYNEEYPNWTDKISIDDMTIITQEWPVIKIVSVDENTLIYDAPWSDENWTYVKVGKNRIRSQNDKLYYYNRK